MTLAETQAKLIGWIVAAAAAAAAVFALDLITPYGTAVPMLYVIPLLITWFVPGLRSTFLMIGLTMPLAWGGTALSSGELTADVVVNRTMASALLLVIGWLVINRKRLAEQRDADQAALRESEERFSKAFNEAAIGMALVAPDGRWLKVNHALCDLVGYAAEELEATTFQAITHPNDLESNLASYELMLAGEIRTYQLEKRYVHKQGHIVWVVVSVSLVRKSDGTPRHFITQIQDITERKVTEAALQEKEEKFRMLAEAMPHFVWQTDSQGEAEFENQRWYDYTGLTHETTGHGGWLTVQHPDDAPRLAEAWKTAVETGGEYEAETRFRRAVDGTYRWFRVRGAPVRDAEGRIRSWVGTCTDTHDRKETEMALRRSEERLQLFVEYAPAAIAMFDKEMKYLAVSRRFLDDYHVTEPDVIGRSHYDVFPDIPDRWREYHRRGLQGEVLHAQEDRFKRADGTTQWLHWEIHPWHNHSGEVGGILLFTEEITERKLADQALRESEERFAKAFRASPHPLGITEVATGRCIEVNDACLQLFGFRREEVIGNTTLMLGIWPNQEHRERLVERLKAGEPVRNLELSFKTKSGELRHILVSSELAELSGKLCLITVGNDITERKQAEDKARRTAADLAEAQRITKLGSWRLDIATDRVWLSDQLYEVFDLKPSPLGESYESFLARVHPDDRPGVVQANVEARARGRPFDVEFRIQMKDGSVRVMREVGYANRDAANRVVGLFGTVQDITDRKLVEEALRKAEAYYRTIFQEAGVGVAQVDSRTGQFFRVNRKYCEMLDFTEDELLATTFMAITHPDDLEEDLGNMERLRRGELSSYTMEKRYLRKDRSIVWVIMNVAPLWQLGETPAQHMAVVQDISARKQMETALRESEERFRHIFEYAGTGIAILNSTGRFVRCNPAYSKMTGYSEDELSQYAFSILIHQDDRDMRERHVAALMRGEIPFINIEIRYLTKSGSTVWVQKLGSLLRSEQGRATHYIVMVTDVTERKETEERLRLLTESLEQRVRERTAALAEANERWDWVVRATNDGVWDWDLLRDTAYFSPRWKEMHGFQESDGPERTKEWATRIHPEDRPRVMDALERCRTGTQAHFHEEYRIQSKDGTYMWVLDQGLAVFNDQGRAFRMIGAESDITTLKASEALLREREAQLSELSARLLGAQEAERRRISRDLHDDVMQRMGALTLDLYGLVSSAASPDGELQSQIKACGASAEQLTTDLQRMAHQLHPSILEFGGLEVAMREQVHEFSSRMGISVELMTRDVPRDIPLDHATCLYRVLQEGLQNVQKHANATTVLVRLLRTGGGLGLCIHDDGRGIVNVEGGARRKGLGLTSMAERVGMLNGIFRVRATPNDGTELHAWVPLEKDGGGA